MMSSLLQKAPPPVKMASSCPLAVIQPGGLVTKEQKEDSMSQHNVRRLTWCPHWQWPHQAQVSCSSWARPLPDTPAAADQRWSWPLPLWSGHAAALPTVVQPASIEPGEGGSSQWLHCNKQAIATYSLPCSSCSPSSAHKDLHILHTFFLPSHPHSLFLIPYCSSRALTCSRTSQSSASEKSLKGSRL